MNRRMWVLSGIGAALLALDAAGVAMLMLDRRVPAAAFMTCLCAAGLLWLLAVAVVRGARLPRRSIWLVLGVAVAMRAMTFCVTPYPLSSDIYRYVWDGRVQLAGINPYRYLPIAPELAPLRDATVYPLINRAEYAHTIYPPAAEMIYALAAAVTPGVFGMKLMMVAFDALAIVALVGLLRIAGRHPAEVLIYAWLPLPVWEIAGSGHIDAVAAGLLALALLVAVRGRTIWSGVLLAAATLTKFLPAVVVPAFWQPRDWRLPAAFAITLVLLYLPYLGVGWHVLGFLGGYATEEGVANGHGLFLLQLLGTMVDLPAWAATVYIVVALLVLGVLAAVFAFRAVPAAAGARVQVQARQAAILGAVVLVAVSPHYPWYFVWLAPLACLAPLPSVLWMLAAAPLLAHGAVETLIVPGTVYVPAALLALLDLRRLPLSHQVIRSA